MAGPWPGPMEGLSALLGLLDEAQYGRTQEPFTIDGQEFSGEDVKMGMAPIDPSGLRAGAGMLSRLKSFFGRGGGDDAARFVANNPLRGGPGAYQGTKPIAGSQGIPHTSPLPNPGPAPRPPSGGPSGSGMFADDAAGMVRGDIPPPPRPGADFAAMDDLGTLGQGPGPIRTGMDPMAAAPNDPGLVMKVLDEFDQMNSMGQVPYEQAVDMLVAKYGDWILGFI